MKNEELEKKLKELGELGLIYLEVNGKRIYTPKYYISNLKINQEM